MLAFYMIMKNEIYIQNKERLESIKNAIKKGGASKLHVLADFDRTLTTAFVDGKSVRSLISILYEGNYLTPDYGAKGQALSQKYHPIEMDPNIPFEEKWAAMDSWWREHSKLLIESGLSRDVIKKAVLESRVTLREGYGEVADLLNKNNIPLVIMSASGLGSDGITQYLEQSDKLYPNVHLVCNQYEWDENGKAVALREPIIHALNKYETSVQDFPAFNEVRERKNVILLGDSIDDIGMVQGFEYDNLITIGFLNDKVEENLEHYKKAFDVVLTGDASMEYVDQLLKEIVE